MEITECTVRTPGGDERPEDTFIIGGRKKDEVEKGLEHLVLIACGMKEKYVACRAVKGSELCLELAVELRTTYAEFIKIEEKGGKR